MNTAPDMNWRTYNDAAPDFAAARTALVNTGPDASTSARRATRTALGRYLRRIRPLDPIRARTAAAWIGWVGYPGILFSDRTPNTTSTDA